MRNFNPLSAGSVRVQFSVPENVQICMYSSKFIQEADKHLSVDGAPAGLQFTEGGYLFLASERGVKILERNHETQKKFGADVVLLSPSQLRQRFPWLNVDESVVAGSLGLSGEGWFDPHSLLMVRVVVVLVVLCLHVVVEADLFLCLFVCLLLCEGI